MNKVLKILIALSGFISMVFGALLLAGVHEVIGREVKELESIVTGVFVAFAGVGMYWMLWLFYLVFFVFSLILLASGVYSVVYVFTGFNVKILRKCILRQLVPSMILSILMIVTALGLRSSWSLFYMIEPVNMFVLLFLFLALRKITVSR